MPDDRARYSKATEGLASQITLNDGQGDACVIGSKIYLFIYCRALSCQKPFFYHWSGCLEVF